MTMNNILQRYRRFVALVCLFVCVFTASAQPGSNEPMNPDWVAARDAVEAYFRAADSGHADRVRSVFHPSGRVEGVRKGALVSQSAEDFANRNFKGEPPAYAATIQRKIEWLDLSGPGAVARVTIKIGPDNTYTDYFILFKAEGAWKVGLKAFANP